MCKITSANNINQKDVIKD